MFFSILVFFFLFLFLSYYFSGCFDQGRVNELGLPRSLALGVSSPIWQGLTLALSNQRGCGGVVPCFSRGFPEHTGLGAHWFGRGGSPPPGCLKLEQCTNEPGLRLSCTRPLRLALSQVNPFLQGSWGSAGPEQEGVGTGLRGAVVESPTNHY